MADNQAVAPHLTIRPPAQRYLSADAPYKPYARPPPRPPQNRIAHFPVSRSDPPAAVSYASDSRRKLIGSTQSSVQYQDPRPHGSIGSSSVTPPRPPPTSSAPPGASRARRLTDRRPEHVGAASPMRDSDPEDWWDAVLIAEQEHTVQPGPSPSGCERGQKAAGTSEIAGSYKVASGGQPSRSMPSDCGSAASGTNGSAVSPTPAPTKDGHVKPERRTLGMKAGEEMPSLSVPEPEPGSASVTTLRVGEGLVPPVFVLDPVFDGDNGVAALDRAGTACRCAAEFTSLSADSALRDPANLLVIVKSQQAVIAAQAAQIASLRAR